MLTNPTNKPKQSRRTAYTDVIGAGSGTILLMFAEKIPDTYWFKTYLLLAVPSLSVSLSTITNIVLGQCKSLFAHLSDLQKEKFISRELKLLKKDPCAPQSSIRKLEQAYLAVRIKRVESRIVRLGRMRND